MLTFAEGYTHLLQPSQAKGSRCAPCSATAVQTVSAEAERSAPVSNRSEPTVGSESGGPGAAVSLGARGSGRLPASSEARTARRAAQGSSGRAALPCRCCAGAVPGPAAEPPPQARSTQPLTGAERPSAAPASPPGLRATGASRRSSPVHCTGGRNRRYPAHQAPLAAVCSCFQRDTRGSIHRHKQSRPAGQNPY